MNQNSTARYHLLFLVASAALAGSLHAQTSNQTSAGVTDWDTGVPTDLASQDSPTGANITTNLVNSALGAASASGTAHVDTTANPNGDPILRAAADATLQPSYNNQAHSTTSNGVAQSTTLFRAGSTTNPVGTSFSSAFEFSVDGSFIFDMGGGIAQPNWSTFGSPPDPYFAPGDQARMNFSLLIRPEDDSIFETTPTQSIEFNTEVLWNADGFAQGNNVIFDALDFSVVGTATVTDTLNSPTERSFEVTGSVPFTATTGWDYRVEMYLGVDAAVRGGSGTAKTVVADFLNSASAQPVSTAPNFSYSVVPEPSVFGLAMGIASLMLAASRRWKI